MERLRTYRIAFEFALMMYCCTLPCASTTRFRNPKKGSVSKATMLEYHLKRLNKPAIKSIQSGDGDIIDCVISTLQPAFDHPLLKNHSIELPPMIPGQPNPPNQGLHNYADVRHSQLWKQSGVCPLGTVAIRRTFIHDILRSQSIECYGRKKGGLDSVPQPDNPEAITNNGHEHAIGYMLGGAHYGAQATINVWRPNVEVESEFSLSQIWILGGSFNSGLNSIEAGWQVSPELYGDNNSRLFTYWTADAYQTTGCYNLLCSGFVQTSHKIAIGAAIAPVSNMEGSQYDIKILLWKDPRKGNWWMRFGDDHLVGYWPAALFTHLAASAFAVEWGGEVVNTQPYGRHTRTNMGSGEFPDQGFSRSSYHRNLEYVDANNILRSPGLIQILAEQPKCYGIQSGISKDWGSYLYYGGPGQTSNCH